MDTTNTTENAKKAGSFISGILTGWGVPANWARVLTGAIIGAVLAAAGIFTQACTAAYTQTAAGDISYHGSIIPLPVDDSSTK